MFAYDENKERRHQEKVCCRGLRSGKQFTNDKKGMNYADVLAAYRTGTKQASTNRFTTR